jgi:serine/threonine-protein kinase mTOR
LLFICRPTSIPELSSSTSRQDGFNEFFEYIFGAIRDPQPIVRACAVDALSQCLKIIVHRRHYLSLTTLLCQVYALVKSGLEEMPAKRNSVPATMTAEAAQHGSLLAVSSLISYCQDFVGPRFQELCEAVFSFTKHSKALDGWK